MAGSVGQYTQAWMPFVGEKSNTGGVTRQNSVGDLAMGYAQTAATQNSEMTWDLYLDSVTWKAAFVTNKGANRGILTLNFDGVSQGTVDLYDPAGGLPNQYNEITGIVVATPGVKAVQIKAATKNASSTNYYLLVSSIALIRTGGTASTPSGTDTPGYTWQHFPWMGNKVEVVGTYKHQAGSTELGGGDGYLLGGAQNDYVDNDIWLSAGTYKYAQVAWKTVDQGIASIQLDAAEQGTIDNYTGSANVNVYTEITGISIATAGIKTFRQKATSKNASSSAYYMVTQSVAWIRTGA